MVKKPDSNKARLKRHMRVRAKISGTPERPRLSVFRSAKHIYAQIIDDVNGVTLASASSMEKGFEGFGGNKEAARKVGEAVAKAALAKGVSEVVVTSTMVVYRNWLRVLARAVSNSKVGGILLARIDASNMELQERVVTINRVSKTVKGGRIFKFAALVVVGDGNGTVGFGLGKASEVPDAIRKGIEDAKKNLVKVSLKGTTIPHEVVGVYGAGRVLMRPAPEGTGLIAGGPVRAVLEVTGVKNIRTKSLRSRNPKNMVSATMQGLMSLRNVDEIAAKRGKSVREIIG